MPAGYHPLAGRCRVGVLPIPSFCPTTVCWAGRLPGPRLLPSFSCLAVRCRVGVLPIPSFRPTTVCWAGALPGPSLEPSFSCLAVCCRVGELPIPSLRRFSPLFLFPRFLLSSFLHSPSPLNTNVAPSAFSTRLTFIRRPSRRSHPLSLFASGVPMGVLDCSVLFAFLR